MSVAVSQTIPEGTFKYIAYSPELESNKLACGVPTNYSTNEWKGKKVLVISVPGAFTPTCHTNHLPPFVQKYDEFKAKGIDIIVVLAANDVFVMSGWARVEGLTDKILAVSDINAKWSESLGLSKDLSALGFGVRTGRYALVIDDLVVSHVFAEEGLGISVSSAENVLSKL